MLINKVTLSRTNHNLCKVYLGTGEDINYNKYNLISIRVTMFFPDTRQKL